MNMILWPLYVITERWQAAERRVQTRLQPKLLEIRQAFSGEERFAMVHTLYRQVGYHPIYALRSSLRMLIQVPFLLAAFQLLSELDPLKGASWWVFDDLMKPDGLLGGVNLMPLVMTGISILSIFFYRPRFGTKETWQFLIISGLFLVLLYPSPVALVLFWTFNILSSLLMNVVYVWLQTTSAQIEKPRILARIVNSNTVRDLLPESLHYSVLRQRILGWGKQILESPYFLALLVGVYPVVFYITANWFMFNMSDGFFIAATFSTIVFLCLSVGYLLLSWCVRKIVVRNPTIVIYRIFIFLSILLLGYLLRQTLLALADQELFVVVGVMVVLAFVVMWFIPRIRLYRVNVILAILCIFHLASGLYESVTSEVNYLEKNVGYERYRTVYDQVKFSKKPNMYYIVPDGYPNREAIDKIFDSDNSEFYQYLESVGFDIHHSALSNYQSTLPSISASFGMGHHYQQGHVGNFELLDSRKFIVSRQNPVVQILKNNGYQVEYIHGDEDLLTSGCFVDSCFPSIFLGEFMNVLIPQELQSVSRLQQEVDLSLSGFTQKVLTQIERVSREPTSHFTYVHMNWPAHSWIKNWTRKGLASFRNDYDYRLEGANKQIAKFVQSILASDPSALIIINADHGAWGLGSYYHASNEVFTGLPESLIGLDQLGVLLAIRWPDGSMNADRDIRSNVNVFRHVFATLSQNDELLANQEADEGFLVRGKGKAKRLVKVAHNGQLLKSGENFVPDY